MRCRPGTTRILTPERDRTLTGHAIMPAMPKVLPDKATARMRHDVIDGMASTAAFSHCGRYRYALWRRWADGPQLLFVMLNPSTASASANDPTIRRCIGFARDWGFAALAVGNLFAWRTPSPARLRQARGPVGGRNDAWLEHLHSQSQLTVAAWGNHGTWRGRDVVVRALLRDPHVLGLTAAGAPRHPLYVRTMTRPQPWAGGGH